MPTALSSASALNMPAPQRVDLKDASFTIDPEAYRTMYNKTPFAFTHNLHQLELFQYESLCEIAAKYTGFQDDYYVAASAAAPGSAFFDAQHIKLTPKDAIGEIDHRPMRILLKRLENHDHRFVELRELLIGQLRSLPGGIGSLPIRRIQSSLFISSAAATTPLHFDPEVNFFTQIEGDKTYHAYSPDDVAEKNLEDFYVRGQVSIGQLNLSERDPQKEHVFQLTAGRGFHQPQNAPHWVETCGARSISFSCVFETSADVSLARTRAFNHYQRKLGMIPTAPGLHPSLDSLKSEVMIPDRFARKVLARIRR